MGKYPKGAPKRLNRGGSSLETLYTVIAAYIAARHDSLSIETPHATPARRLRVTGCVNSPGFSLVGEKLRIPHAKPARALLLFRLKMKKALNLI